jgi:hypothetical protein
MQAGVARHPRGFAKRPQQVGTPPARSRRQRTGGAVRRHGLCTGQPRARRGLEIL